MSQEFYGYFDNAEGDARSYASEQLAKAFRALAADGVSGQGDLLVSAEGGTMRTTVAPGLAVLRGYIYELIDDGGAVKAFTHEVSGAAARFDRVVLQLNLQTRAISLYVKTGAPAANPVAPALTNNAQTRELSLARVQIRAGADAILPSDVTDERWDESCCGACVPDTLKKSALDARYRAMASASGAGWMTASQFSSLTALLNALYVTQDAVNVRGRYLDNALFR